MKRKRDDLDAGSRYADPSARIISISSITDGQTVDFPVPKPLPTIREVFNEICILFDRDTRTVNYLENPATEEKVDKETPDFILEDFLSASSAFAVSFADLPHQSAPASAPTATVEPEVTVISETPTKMRKLEENSPAVPAEIVANPAVPKSLGYVHKTGGGDEEDDDEGDDDIEVIDPMSMLFPARFDGQDIQGQFDLMKLIDEKQSYCLNESKDHKMLSILKTEPSVRASDKAYLESDCDDQLLICIRFTSEVRLMHLVIGACQKDDRYPSTIRLFANQPSMDFSNVDDSPATQEIVFKPTPPALHSAEEDSGSVLVKLNVVKFGRCSSVTMYVTGNLGGAETTVLNRIRCIGQPLRLKKI